MGKKSIETKTETVQKENKNLSECPFDFQLCRKALVALKQIITNAQQGHKKLLDESIPISLYLHVHKIPRCTYLRLASQLPHPFIQQDTRDVCLFVRDDDISGRDFESTIRRFKSMIDQFKLPFNIDIMTLKQLNQELVPYEAKRKLCARYDLFLADRRIMTSLMRGQLLGKHFRHHGKMPLGINVFNKDFKQRLTSLCSSIFGRMAGTGPLFSMQFTTVQQSIDHGIENLKSICETIGQELPGSWLNIGHAYLYGNNLQSLPIYYSTHNKNDVKKLNLPSNDPNELTHIGELSTIDKNLNVIVEPNGNIHLTKRTKLNNNFKKKKPTKRLQKIWTKGIQKSSTDKHQSKKQKNINNRDDDTPNFNTDGKPLVDTAFVKRISSTRLAKKSDKPKHKEENFASKPAPRAEKRKRLLAAAKQSSKGDQGDDVPTLVDDSEERKIKSGGRNDETSRIMGDIQICDQQLLRELLLQLKIDVLLPIVVFACNRPRALQTHIEALLKIRKNPDLNPIIVSLDCNDQATLQVAKNFSNKIKTIIQLPDLGPIIVPPENQLLAGYYKIARHYNYSLNRVLNEFNYDAIIITEDDLEVSPDFLDYFQAVYPLLKVDKTIWCISAWNDNGIDQKINRQADLLHRSDFFPGLGWLLTKTVWNEIKDHWPPAFWDDWMRKPEQRRDRVCIRPEVSRTGISPEGKKGVSGGQFYDSYLRKIIKNTDPIDWKSIDLNYLIKDQYDPVFDSRVNACSVITVSDLNMLDTDLKCARLRYSNKKEFIAIADVLQIMNDFKDNVPRTAYRGVVQCRYDKTRIYVTSNQQPWRSYAEISE
ncbi:unnamed protein product [Adineta steineri]|uniref:alpha-1,3-mannosyl-glycoprotein 2-beta-N-acetylglucosaminyltransferase n=1 Tax=Adineta steineri TaxID=433720 RepID=A0A814CDC3_9BILA|nr:unnamed protein product [Adineta steineri]CAF0938580.1 unnamed protein product [Adineta steineri]